MYESIDELDKAKTHEDIISLMIFMSATNATNASDAFDASIANAANASNVSNAADAFDDSNAANASAHGCASRDHSNCRSFSLRSNLYSCVGVI